jgi:pimeloyl-ACP methyl ester carboxylesterase
MAERRVAVDGVELSVEERGGGRPIVVVHGFPLDRAMWAAQIESLGGEFRVIAPDLRGFGQSSLAPEDAEQGVGMERYAADVLGVLDALGVAEPVVLVGFSMGGYAAWQFALQWPERLAGLVQCDTRAVADTDDARAGRLKMAEAVQAAGDSSPALAMLPKLLAEQTSQSRPEVVAQVRAMIERQTAAAVAAAQRGMARREDVRSRLSEINCPALAIVGAEDAISPPEEMRKIVAAMPHASLVEIPAAGHMTTMENPSAVTQAIADFARSLDN